MKQVDMFTLLPQMPFYIRSETFDLILTPDQRSTDHLQFRLEIIVNVTLPSRIWGNFPPFCVLGSPVM